VHRKLLSKGNFDKIYLEQKKTQEEPISSARKRLTAQIVHSSLVRQIFYRVCSNRVASRKGPSDKLIEGAVNDFATRQYAGSDLISRYGRATNYVAGAVRRRQ